MRVLIGLAGMLAFVACSADYSTTVASANLVKPGPTAQVATVTATATVGGQSAAGDTVFLDITNSGATTAFFPRCGTEPLVLTQEFVNGVWTAGVQNFSCVTSTTSNVFALTAGAHIRVMRLFPASGQFRFILNCATVPDLKDTSPCLSNPFEVLIQTLPSAGAVLTVKVSGHSADGDSVLVDVANLGTTALYLDRCGDGPLILLQQFVNGVWIGGIENISCATSTEPGPIKLAAGAHLPVVRVLGAPGRYRYLARVATLPDLGDIVPVMSNPFDIP